MPKKQRKAEPKPAPVKAWAGVVEGRIHGWMTMEQPYYEIYRRRSDAKKNYEKIVRIEIRPL